LIALLEGRLGCGWRIWQITRAPSGLMTGASAVCLASAPVMVVLADVVLLLAALA